MSVSNKSTRAFSVLLCSLAVLFLLVSTASAIFDADVSVKLPDDTIKSGENYDVFIILDPQESDSSVNTDMEITVDGVVVHQKSYTLDFEDGVRYNITVNSGDFKTEDMGKPWKENLMSYDCGDDKDVKVTFSDDIEAEDSDTLTIENSGDKEISSYDLTPDPLNLDAKVNVTVYDQDDDKLEGASVKITYLEEGADDGVWDYEDKYVDDTTNSKGRAEFSALSKAISTAGKGKYQLDIWMDGYCKVMKEYSVQNTLNISDTDPASPKVGESFKVMITTPSGNPATGLIVSLTPGNLKAQVLSTGYATFTVQSSGSYTLDVGGGTTGYDEVMKSITVGTKQQLIPSISPDSQSVGKPVIITVKADGKEIEGATVKVTPPQGAEQTLPGTTSSAGTIAYTPTVPGTYSVRALEGGYDEGTDSFSAQNSFQITLPQSSELKNGNQATITVNDQSGNPVDGASVSIVGTPISGVTDVSGKFTFTVGDAGSYNVLVKKTGYVDGSATMSSTGQLQVSTDKQEINLDDPVKVTVTTSDGAPVEATIRLNGPDSQSFTGSTVAITPKKAGSYTVEASKANYVSASVTLKVNPRPLILSYQFKDDNLVINATSGNKPAANVVVKVTAAGNTYTVVTDTSGIATVVANSTGDYTLKVDSGDYAPTTVNATKSSMSGLSDLWVPVLIGLVALVLIGIFAVVLISLLYRRKGVKPAFKRSSGSRLNK